jgi:hypothetical protein
MVRRILLLALLCLGLSLLGGAVLNEGAGKKVLMSKHGVGGGGY